jgi:hypothetical protein
LRELATPAAPGSGEPNLAAGADGSTYLSWIEPRPDSAHALRFAARGPGGAWTEPRTIAQGKGWFVNWADFPSVLAFADGWVIDGCPVNGPAVAADDSRVAVAWFSAPAAEGRVQVAFSSDSGGTYGAPVRVDDRRPIGRVDVVLLPGGDALVSWIEQAAAGAEVRLRTVSRSGRRGPALTAPPSSEAR